MGIVLFIASNGLALFASSCLARALLPGTTRLERALAVAAGLPIVVLPTATLLGMLSLFTPLGALLAMVVVAGASCLWLRRHAASGEASVQPAPELSAAVSVETRISVGVLGAALGLLGLQACAFIAKQAFQGWEPHWDDISYHAPMPAHWIQSARLGLAPYNYHAYYPGTGELFAAWFMLPTRLDAFASLAGLHWMVLCALAVALICRRLELPAHASVLAVTMLFACRPFIDQAGSFAAVDLAGAACLAAAIAMALGVTRDAASAQLRVRVFYVGCLVGLAVGTKVTCATVGVLVLGWMLWEQRAKLRDAAAQVALFGGCALICGGYWYARNFWITGNPFFPARLLFFEGPLDPDALRRTSLSFLLRQIDGAALQRAFQELLQWPSTLAYLFLAGYALTLLSWLRWGWWRDPRQRRLALCALAGLVALATSVSGPFSGSSNTPVASQLLIRLRFFLLVALLGLPLLAHWLRYARALLPALVLGLVVLVAATGGYPALEITVVLATGAALALASSARPWLRPPGLAALVPLLWLLLPSFAAYAMLKKQPENERAQRKTMSSWNAAERIPDGARLTWFSTYEGYKYYRGFGSRLEREPVAVNWDGKPYVFLHEDWRQYQPTWWRSRRRPLNMSRLISNLQAQRIEYVLLMKRTEGRWSAHYKIFKASNQASLVRQQKSYALFKLAKAEPIRE